ncbi:M28 family metallopeptidase [Clostridium septicum]|uniref:M28 family metallopeptidase n=1 Tax=Clostridium septicum TaxID=1504 RepID=UPI004040F9FD
MKKKVSYYLLILFITTALGFSIFFNITYSQFNSNNVKKNIANFSSQTYSGRLPGSDENNLVAEIIRKNFQDNKLTPLNDNYRENFNTVCPVKTNTQPYMQISTKGIVLEELKYGVDFKDDMINFKKNTITFSRADTVNIYTKSIDVITSDAKCLFYVNCKEDFSFRSSFSSDFPYDMVISVNTNTYNKILDSVRKGLEISVHVPFENEEKTISNVVGVLKGSSHKLPPLVLTAHYDHLGKDGLENLYSGALDNASGTSFLLELQRSLSTYGKPKRDIIFVALNAEEFGLLGSKEFAEKNIDKLHDAEVINFDMIGSEGYPLTFMQGLSFKDKDSKLLKSVEKIAKNKGVKTEVVYQDSSDHASFNNAGIDSLSFCHSDVSRIHTPNDTAEFISTNAIDTAYEVVEAKILGSSYGFLTRFFYSKISIILFSILLIVWIAYGVKKRNVSE